MYEQCFNLTARPFTSTPFVEHYFASESMQQSLTSARLCIDRGNGPIIVVGEAGTGKSLLLAMLEDQYRAQFHVANLSHSSLGERRELLQSILFELSLPYKGMDEGELRLSLMDYLKPSTACPNGVLLLVDEADRMPVELLDEIRLITNFVSEGKPRVRLVMAGSQRLEDKLNDPKLVSFNQRLAARCYLSQMSKQETADYVTSHVDRAGGQGKQLFNAASLQAIHEVADGCPRYVNQVCDHAMILAATRGETTIDDQIVYEAWADVQSLPGMSTPSSSMNQVAGSSVSEDLGSDESWTVIEFGSLDDETPSPTTSVYDFNATEEDGSNDEGNSIGSVTENASVSDDVADDEEYRLEPEEELGQYAVADTNSEASSIATGVDALAASQAAEISRLVSQIESSSLETGSDNDSPQHLQPVDRRSAETEELEQVGSAQGSEQQNVIGTCDESSFASAEETGFANGVTEKAEPVADCENPFDEEFEDEELVQDAYAAQVAIHNQSSLDLTADHIALIQPIDEATGLEQAIEMGAGEPDSNGDFKPDEVEASTAETNEEFVAVDSGLDATEPDVEHEVADSVGVANVNDSGQHFSESQNSELAGEDDISRKADEILKSIQLEEEPVSCETDSMVASLSDNKPTTSDSGLMANDESQPVDETTQRSLEESQLLLEQIIKENNERAAGVQPDSTVESLATDMPESIAYPGTDGACAEPAMSEQALVDPETEVADDRDMLIVSRQDQPAMPESQLDEPIPFPSTPVSTGQAQRMDYQQLFDQLRNISGS